MTLTAGGVLPLWAGSLATLTSSARACFASEGGQACTKALLQAEDLQRTAAYQDRYPCQSLLLGLQAEVVMVQFGAARGGEAFKTLAAVQGRCKGL